MRSLARFPILVSLFLVAIHGSAQERILFLGNSITYDGRYIVDLETWTVMAHPEKHIEFMNLGLPSETVSGLSEEGHAGGKFPRPDLHERLARVLAATRPDVVFVDYGMNDGIYLPLDSVRFAAYKKGMTWLHAELERSGIKYIFIFTPPIHDDPVKGLSGYNLVLDEYSRWLLSREDWNVIDLHFPMKAYLEERRKTESGFKLAEDGVHPGDLGHWLMAREFIRFDDSLHLPKGTTSVFDVVGYTPKARAVHALVAKRQGIMKDAWLKRTGFIRPDMPEGLPFDEAEKRAKVIDEEIRKLLGE
jgi:lysophospholipase L1-like esterase